MHNRKSVFITGGTGSFGKKFLEMVLEKYPNLERVVIYSRDELKQFEMLSLPFIQKYKDKIRFLIGDVRDTARLTRAVEGCEVIIHAAALKQVPTAEYNPMECIKTNVLGAYSVIEAAMAQGVKDVIALSTDKAAAPINLYGATKLCSDKLFVAANNMRGKRDVKFSVVRYGNVLGSRGSVIPFFLKKKNEKTLPITHKDMTRFSISLEDGVNFVLQAIESHWGGEIYIPKIPSYKILDVAKAVNPNCEYEDIGVRPGEKLHEEMITEMDSLNTVEFNNHYVILPSTPMWNVNDYIDKNDGKKVELGFKYNSGTNPEFLNIEQIRDEIRTHVDPSFNV